MAVGTLFVPSVSALGTSAAVTEASTFSKYFIVRIEPKQVDGNYVLCEADTGKRYTIILRDDQDKPELFKEGGSKDEWDRYYLHPNLERKAQAAWAIKRVSEPEERTLGKVEIAKIKQ